jgi:hypothetical protein
MNTLLGGFAHEAKHQSNMPQRAMKWIDRFYHQHHIKPSIQSYMCIVQAWSNSTHHYNDAAHQAEFCLRNDIFNLYRQQQQQQQQQQDVSTGGGGGLRHRRQHQHHHYHNSNGVADLAVCLNIVLKAWANQATSFQRQNDPEKSRLAVERALRLFYDVVRLKRTEEAETGDGSSSSSSMQIVVPSEGTFRSMLHVIVGGHLSNKDTYTKSILNMMRDHGFRPDQKDIELVERTSSRHHRHRHGGNKEGR